MIPFSKLKTHVQYYIDKSVPYTWQRWCVTLAILIIYFSKSHFVVTYVVSLYALNIFIGFISPQVDPVLEGDDGLSLPFSNDEFRPFIRKLPELKLTISYSIALFCTFFFVFDLPVFWPVLLFYFLLLSFVTLKAQLEHMIRYRYFPADFGKKTYFKRR